MEVKSVINDQILKLVAAHASHNDIEFNETVKSIALAERKKGNTAYSISLKRLLSLGITTHAVNKHPFNEDSKNLFELVSDTRDKDDLIVDKNIQKALEEVISEFDNRDKLVKVGLENNRKLLLEGAPGTGKTMTAIALSSELNLPLYRQQTDELIDGILGGTAANLRTVFQIIHNHLGIYLFDEFDSIATQRQVSQNSADNEMRRALNSLLQFIENDNSQSFIIATTNMKSILDLALFRRFDVVLHYSLPDQKLRKLMFQRQLEKYKINVPITEDLLNISEGLSQSDIVKVCQKAAKHSILSNESVKTQQLIFWSKEVKGVYEY